MPLSLGWGQNVVFVYPLFILATKKDITKVHAKFFLC